MGMSEREGKGMRERERDDRHGGGGEIKRERAREGVSERERGSE